MTQLQIVVLFALCLATMLLCRCVPMFALKGRQLSEGTKEALNLIPPAAFAALVANDLFSPGMFDAGLWPGLFPLLASAAVVAVALKTRSLVWCAVAGVAAYALLGMVPL